MLVKLVVLRFFFFFNRGIKIVGKISVGDRRGFLINWFSVFRDGIC